MIRRRLSARSSFFVACACYACGAALLFGSLLITESAKTLTMAQSAGILLASVILWPFFAFVAVADPDLASLPLGIASGILFFAVVLFLVHAIRVRQSIFSQTQ